MGGGQVQAERRGPGRPREERVTRQVLDAVLALVTEQGMDAVTMDAVAARAGVSKPTMYRRWPTKQDLVFAAAESRVGPVAVPDLGDFRAELTALLTARLAIWDNIAVQHYAVNDYYPARRVMERIAIAGVPLS